ARRDAGAKQLPFHPIFARRVRREARVDRTRSLATEIDHHCRRDQPCWLTGRGHPNLPDATAGNAANYLPPVPTLRAREAVPPARETLARAVPLDKHSRSSRS